MRAFLVPSFAPRREEVPALPEAEGQMSWRSMLGKLARFGHPKGKYGDIRIFTLKNGMVAIEITDHRTDIVSILQLSQEEATGIAHRILRSVDIAERRHSA